MKCAASTRIGGSLIRGADCIIRCTGFLSKSRFPVVEHHPLSGSAQFHRVQILIFDFSVSFHIPFSTFFSNEIAIPLRWLLIPLLDIAKGTFPMGSAIDVWILILIISPHFRFPGSLCFFASPRGRFFHRQKKKIRRLKKKNPRQKKKKKKKKKK